MRQWLTPVTHPRKQRAVNNALMLLPALCPQRTAFQRTLLRKIKTGKSRTIKIFTWDVILNKHTSAQNKNTYTSRSLICNPRKLNNSRKWIPAFRPCADVVGASFYLSAFGIFSMDLQLFTVAQINFWYPLNLLRLSLNFHPLRRCKVF